MGESGPIKTPKGNTSNIIKCFKTNFLLVLAFKNKLNLAVGCCKLLSHWGRNVITLVPACSGDIRVMIFGLIDCNTQFLILHVTLCCNTANKLLQGFFFPILSFPRSSSPSISSGNQWRSYRWWKASQSNKKSRRLLDWSAVWLPACPPSV